MIVVSDTSPVTALLTIGQAEILQKLFGQVIVPQSVREELSRSHRDLPSWLHVEAIKDLAKKERLRKSVDAGEAEAIVLAKELGADQLLIDEKKGRRIAISEGIPVIGLLGVVLLAKRSNLLPSARAVLDRLDREAGVYLSETLRETALRAVGE